MYGSMNTKFIKTKQAIEIHAYKNTKRKLYKTNAVIWFNNVCKPEAANTVRAPDDERYSARNMLSLQWTVK